MAKSKAIFALYYCTGCRYPSKVTRRSPKKALPEKSRYCKRCKKHMPHKARDIKKPVKK